MVYQVFEKIKVEWYWFTRSILVSLGAQHNIHGMIDNTLTNKKTYTHCISLWLWSIFDIDRLCIYVAMWPLLLYTSWIHIVLYLVAMIFVTLEHGYAHLTKKEFLLDELHVPLMDEVLELLFMLLLHSLRKCL